MSASWENPVTWLKWQLCSQFSNSPETSGECYCQYSQKLNDAERAEQHSGTEATSPSAQNNFGNVGRFTIAKQVGEGEAILVPSPIEKLQL